MTNMRLPNEVLLDILRHTARRDLDWLPMVNRCLARLIVGNVDILSLRLIESASINAVPEKGTTARNEGSMALTIGTLC